MKRLLSTVFFALGILNCFGQYKGVPDFYEKMFENEQFREFNSKHLIPIKDYSTRNDTTRINKTYTYVFDKHPYLDESSGGGRLEKFISICADSTSVYEVSSRLYISFKKISEGKNFLNTLLDRLEKVSWKTTTNKTKVFEEYIVYGKELIDSNGNPKTSFHSASPCIIKLRLTQNKGVNECELGISL